ncbi:MAG TPA: hypothetical protein VKR52_04555 [Terracidiphilus sp.]|nr:hypothetical protein [Terracidiphilus sp.]
MTFQELQREASKKLLDVAIGASGFLIALAINSWMDNQHDKETYRAIATSVTLEFVENKSKVAVITGPGMTLDKAPLEGEVRDAAITSALANPLFVKHVSIDDLTHLFIYADTLEEVKRRHALLDYAAFNGEGSGLQKDAKASDLIGFWQGGAEALQGQIKLLEDARLEESFR